MDFETRFQNQEKITDALMMFVMVTIRNVLSSESLGMWNQTEILPDCIDITRCENNEGCQTEHT